MSAAALLDRLRNVRPAGPGRWTACCPCHESKSRSSLSVQELPDGRVLVHDFGGCEVGDVLHAVGLSFDALFPPRPVPLGERQHAPDAVFAPGIVLRAVAGDVATAAVIAGDLARGRVEPEVVRERLWTLAGRLAAAVELTKPAKRDKHGRRR